VRDGRRATLRSFPRHRPPRRIDITSYSSGNTRSPGHLSKQGSPLLRQALCMRRGATVMFTGSDPVIRFGW